MPFAATRETAIAETAGYGAKKIETGGEVNEGDTEDKHEGKEAEEDVKWSSPAALKIQLISSVKILLLLFLKYISKFLSDAGGGETDR